jgi:dTDP-glucose 4,6-dehydratase
LVNTGISIKIAQSVDPVLPPQRYVPSVARAREDLALESWVSLEQAITKTIIWLRSNNHE